MFENSFRSIDGLLWKDAGGDSELYYIGPPLGAPPALLGTAGST